MAARLSAQPAAPMAADGAAGLSDALLASLPSLDEIFAAPVATRDFVAAGLLPQARKEFLRCVANVLQHNCLDDWERDIMATRRCRLAWTELFIFPKTCLPVLPGGRAKGRRNHNVIINRLERWGLGERRALWDEAVGKPRRPRGHISSLEERQVTAAVQLACRGMPGKAMQRLSGAPVAEPIPEIVAAMRNKFPPRPTHQHSSSRPPAPPANEVSVEDVIGAEKPFLRGAAPGPTGLRPDFLKQIVGDGGDVLPGAHLLTSLINLFADGRAPAPLRLYLGGAQGTTLEKTSKTGQSDVRPLCAGEALRRLVGKVLLRSELPVLRENLLPYQLAVGVPAGIEVMPHLHRQWQTTFAADADRICLSYDESNAHNVLDRHAFLIRMHEVTMVFWLVPPAKSSVPSNIGHALEAFDPAIHDTFCEMTGLTTDALAWEQATLPASSGGLGLRSSVLLADAAYIGSRHATLECCATLWPLFCWDGGLPGTDLHATLERYRASIADVGLQYPLGTQPSTQMTQSSLSAQLGAAQCVRWLARANNDDACRLHAYSADGADAALGLVPLHVRPQLEVPGILPGRRRPADILVRGAAGLFPRLPDGSRPHGLAPLALEVAVMNALGEGYWDETRRHSSAAASGYAARKRVHNPTATACDQIGAVYLPLVWEAQGGCIKEIRAFLHQQGS
ncbi:Uncharacterized protein SCF082_LOCUS2056 [Durusdinium trenchii]|uniref:Uncharacterized protein n=1 Tax=Durusdinium trenchii TaxID=1381693 RepID=A0ABP0HIB0_9DINO